MKMGNNKGLTLTELLVSIVMLTISMVLMYGLMSNLQKKKSEVDLATENMVKVSDIELTIQKYMMQEPSDINFGRYPATLTLTNITDGVKVTIKTENNEYENEIKASSHIITYSQKINNSVVDGATTKWNMNDNKTCRVKNYCNEIENYCTSYSAYIVIECVDSSNLAPDFIKIPIIVKASDTTT